MTKRVRAFEDVLTAVVPFTAEEAERVTSSYSWYDVDDSIYDNCKHAITAHQVRHYKLKGNSVVTQEIKDQTQLLGKQLFKRVRKELHGLFLKHAPEVIEMQLAVILAAN
jgi:hypothetical protein